MYFSTIKLYNCISHYGVIIINSRYPQYLSTVLLPRRLFSPSFGNKLCAPFYWFGPSAVRWSTCSGLGPQFRWHIDLLCRSQLFVRETPVRTANRSSGEEQPKESHSTSSPLAVVILGYVPVRQPDTLPGVRVVSEPPSNTWPWKHHSLQ